MTTSLSIADRLRAVATRLSSAQTAVSAATARRQDLTEQHAAALTAAEFERADELAGELVSSSDELPTRVEVQSALQKAYDALNAEATRDQQVAQLADLTRRAESARAAEADAAESSLQLLRQLRDSMRAATAARQAHVAAAREANTLRCTLDNPDGGVISRYDPPTAQLDILINEWAVREQLASAAVLHVLRREFGAEV